MLYELNKEHAVLLVIDMQKGFVDENAAMEVPEGRAIVPRIKLLIECCRDNNIPVVFTRFIYSAQVPNLIGELHPQHKPPTSCCLLGDISAEIIEVLAPQPHDMVVDKHGYDAFHQTRLDYSLRSLKKKQLIFTGVMTDICVLSSVTSALHHEYQTWTVSDATATLWPNVQEVTLDLIRRAYGTVTETSKLIGQLER